MTAETEGPQGESIPQEPLAIFNWMEARRDEGPKGVAAFLRGVEALDDKGVTKGPALLQHLRNLGKKKEIWEGAFDNLTVAEERDDFEAISKGLRLVELLGMEEFPAVATHVAQVRQKYSLPAEPSRPEAEDAELAGLRGVIEAKAIQAAGTTGINGAEALFREWQAEQAQELARSKSEVSLEAVVGRFYQRSELKNLNSEEEAEIRKLIGDLQVAYTAVSQDWRAMDLERRLEDSLGLGVDERAEAIKEESEPYGHLESQKGYIVDGILQAYQEGFPQRLFPDSDALQDKFDKMLSAYSTAHQSFPDNPDRSTIYRQLKSDFLYTIYQTVNDEVARARLDQYYQQSEPARNRYSQLMAIPVEQNSISAVREGLVNKNRALLEHYEALNYSGRKVIHFMLDAVKRAGVNVQIEHYWLAPYLVRQDFLSRVRLPDPDKIVAAANLFEQLRGAHSRPAAEGEETTSKNALIRSLEEQIGQTLDLADDERVEGVDQERNQKNGLDRSGDTIIDKLLENEVIDPAQLFPGQVDLQTAFQQLAEAKKLFRPDSYTRTRPKEYYDAHTAFMKELRKALGIDFASNQGSSRALDAAKRDLDTLISNPASSVKELTLAFLMRNKLAANWERLLGNDNRKEAQYLFDGAGRAGITFPHHTVLNLAKQGVSVPAEMLQAAQEDFVEQRRVRDREFHHREIRLTPKERTQLTSLFDQLRGKHGRLRGRWLAAQENLGLRDKIRERNKLEEQISRLLNLPYDDHTATLLHQRAMPVRFSLIADKPQNQPAIVYLVKSPSTTGEIRARFTRWQDQGYPNLGDTKNDLDNAILDLALTTDIKGMLVRRREEAADARRRYQELMEAGNTPLDQLIDAFRKNNRAEINRLGVERIANDKWNNYWVKLAEQENMGLQFKNGRWVLQRRS
ncbi:TPA: hypothetical protein DEP06_00915 [Candidatus Daviesbacteria bacterium]|nr:hypothetical protein [Candidatus Daviesbacteria bacterium]